MELLKHEIVVRKYNGNSLKNAPFDKLSILIQDSFKERLECGLNFGCAYFSADDIRFHTEHGYLFVAYDCETPVGMVALNINNNRCFRSGVHELLAVSTTHKGKGIASLLFRELKKVALDENIDFISSSTAVNAMSSIKYHKKNGFKICRLVSYAGTNYYSYYFILPLRKFKLFNYKIVRIPFYCATYLVCKTFKRVDGTSRFLKK